MKILEINNFSETASLCVIELNPNLRGNLIVQMPPGGKIDTGPVDELLTKAPGFDRMMESLQKYADGEPIVLGVEYSGDNMLSNKM